MSLDINKEQVIQFTRQLEVAEKYMEQGYPNWTALIMAGDYLSRERAEKLLAEGESVWNASVMVGSYQRFDWVIEKYSDELITTEELAEHICSLWRGADPDDTNPYFLFPWEECRDVAGHMLSDSEKELPSGDYITIYRGQLSNNEEDIGLSWSLDKDIAKRFATGAAMRMLCDGWLATAKVPKSEVIAYITGRGEEEVIINPNSPEDITWEEVSAAKK